jgi:hypothetical protein
MRVVISSVGSDEMRKRINAEVVDLKPLGN